MKIIISIIVGLAIGLAIMPTYDVVTKAKLVHCKDVYSGYSLSKKIIVEDAYRAEMLSVGDVHELNESIEQYKKRMMILCEIFYE